jgi:hypothetical protein
MRWAARFDWEETDRVAAIAPFTYFVSMSLLAAFTAGSDRLVFLGCVEPGVLSARFGASCIPVWTSIEPVELLIWIVSFTLLYLTAGFERKLDLD